MLIDFGIARQFLPNLTQTHSVHVTPGFAPIEQYDEQARRGEFTDVYGLAATLYCLLTGKIPPPAFMRIVRDYLTPPRQVNQSVSYTVNRAILAGMAVQPHHRPQSVQEWLQLLLPTSPADDLSSERGIDYSRLRDLLTAGNWKDADKETADRMLSVIGKKSWWDVSTDDLEKFPRTNLRTIDTLWVKYSDGRFGFSVQKRIWQSVGGHPENYDYEIYKKFGDRVGWYEEEKGTWKSSEDLNFTLNSPQGHFPAARRRGGGWWVWCFGLFSLVETCKV